VVDAAESLFVPVAVRNNSKGDEDARTLRAFGEPAWNNPVVRVVDADRKDLAPRLHRDWSVAGVTGLMTEGLRKADRDVPPWLDLLAREAAARRKRLETAVFAMG
jgi:hypothetical protein